MSLPNKGLTIREVGREAADTLTSIHSACFPNYWDISAFNDFFSVPGTFAHVAEMDGEPVGIVVHRVQFEEAELLTLCVLPELRRLGIAAQLLDVCLDKARASGAERMFLDVEDGNVAALHLYERCGFAHVRRRKCYYKQKDGSFTDALVMQGKLY